MSQSVNTKGRTAELETLNPAHYSSLYDLESRIKHAPSWRFQGETPSPDRFAASLWDGVLCNLVIRSRASAAIVGSCTSYKADLRNGTCEVALIGDQDQEWFPALEGFALGLVYLFDTWPFRKIYAEVDEYNLAHFPTLAASLFVEEARLSDHVFRYGQTWDTSILALRREAMDEVREVLFRFWSAERLAPNEVVGSPNTWDEFARLYSSEFGKPMGSLAASDGLPKDLVARSAIITFCERVANREVPGELISELRTLDDCWAFVR